MKALFCSVCSFLVHEKPVGTPYSWLSFREAMTFYCPVLTAFMGYLGMQWHIEKSRTVFAYTWLSSTLTDHSCNNHYVW